VCWSHFLPVSGGRIDSVEELRNDSTSCLERKGMDHWTADLCNSRNEVQITAGNDVGGHGLRRLSDEIYRP
jgi:hypothetical protein